MASSVQDMAVERSPSPQSSTTAGSPLVGGSAAAGTGGGVENRRAQVLAPVRLACAGPVDLVRALYNPKKSAAPSRVFWLEDGAWKDHTPAVVEAVGEGFVAGRSIVEVPVGGSPCLFDFGKMVQMDVATAAQKPVAWIDVHGRTFFPRMADGGGPKMEAELRSDKNGGAAPSEGPLGEHWDENRVVSCPGGLDRPSCWAGLQVLDERDWPYKIVEKIFVERMRRSAPPTRITSIRKCSNGGASGASRKRAFQMWQQMTKAARGTANLKYGWYGAPAVAVASVVRHGFGQPNNESLRPAAQAVGVYLAPAHFPHASASISDPDHAGERHVVLCRVILGKPEKVDMASPQCHPSGDAFDSGVDDLEKPSWYIVWGTRMNTHILPEYVVSFRTSEAGAPPRVTKGLLPQRAPTGMPLSLPQLFAGLGKLIPASKSQALEALFNHFKARKLTKDVFLRNLRAIAGDELLALIKRFHSR